MSRLNRQLADVEFARSTLERQKSSLESELTASQQEVAGLKSTVAQMSAAQAGIEAELAATKVTTAAEQLGKIRTCICSWTNLHAVTTASTNAHVSLDFLLCFSSSLWSFDIEAVILLLLYIALPRKYTQTWDHDHLFSRVSLFDIQSEAQLSFSNITWYF